METQLTTLKVNLQEGLILDNSRVVGCYSHHNNVVAFTDYSVYYKLPDDFKNYEVLINWTDSIGLTVWTDDGDKDLHNFKRMVKSIKGKIPA